MPPGLLRHESTRALIQDRIYAARSSSEISTAPRLKPFSLRAGHSGALKAPAPSTEKLPAVERNAARCRAAFSLTLKKVSIVFKNESVAGLRFDSHSVERFMHEEYRHQEERDCQHVCEHRIAHGQRHG